jgi:antitoxin YefM
MHTYSMGEVREHITRLPEQFAQELQTEGEIEAVTVTRHGKPVLAILPWDLYESIIETMEILGDQEQMAALRKGIQALEQGETVSSEDVKARLGL